MISPVLRPGMKTSLHALLRVGSLETQDQNGMALQTCTIAHHLGVRDDTVGLW